MSIKLNKHIREDIENDDYCNESRDNESELEEDGNAADEDSIIELGQIAILSASKASLRCRNLSESMVENKRDEYTSCKLLNKSGLLLDKSKILDYDKPYVDYNQESSSNSLIEKLKKTILPLRGYFFGIMSAFCFCLSQITIRRSKWLSGSDHSTIRYITTFVVMAIFMKYKKMSLLGPKKQFNLLLFRGFTGSCALILIYFAIMFLNPSDVAAIAHSSIIITAMMSRIFLKEKLTFAHLISIILTVIGVLLISKPSFLFPQNNYLLDSLKNNSTKLNCTQTDLAQDEDCNKLIKSFDIVNSNERLKLIVGISLTIMGSFFSSLVYLVLKKLSNSKVHWACSTIVVCWFGLPFSLIISVILVNLQYFHKNFNQERKDLPMDIFYSVIASLMSLCGQIFLNISFKYEDATKIAITKTVDVFFLFILQFFLLDIIVDAYGIIGALSILTGTFFVLLFKLLENKYENYKEKQNTSTNEKEMTTNSSANESTMNKTENSEMKILDQTNINQKTSIKNFILKFIFFKF